mmetsp:Transcript_30059/g.48017  ORF Transcript_30059/g.48017 Transcript_30059/m.48017 type:complete len:268 (+) Transcript_30059:1502-2305(+)
MTAHWLVDCLLCWTGHSSVGCLIFRCLVDCSVGCCLASWRPFWVICRLWAAAAPQRALRPPSTQQRYPMAAVSGPDSPLSSFFSFSFSFPFPFRVLRGYPHRRPLHLRLSFSFSFSFFCVLSCHLHRRPLRHPPRHRLSSFSSSFYALSCPSFSFSPSPSPLCLRSLSLSPVSPSTPFLASLSALVLLSLSIPFLILLASIFPPLAPPKSAHFPPTSWPVSPSVFPLFPVFVLLALLSTAVVLASSFPPSPPRPSSSLLPRSSSDPP